jgi:hypothetical protein
MTKSRRGDYETVGVARWLCATPRRAAAVLLTAITIVAAIFVLSSLVASAAQLRSALGAVATLAEAEAEVDARVEPAASVRSSPPSPPAPSLPAHEAEPDIPPAVIAEAIEREAAATPGPPSAYEFARLLDNGLLGEQDPAAAEELRRALDGAAAF